MRLKRLHRTLAKQKSIALAGQLASLLLLAVVTMGRGQEQATVHWREKNACGVTAVYTMLKMLGTERTFADVSEQLPLTEMGTNLSEMATACDSLGLQVEVLRLSPNQLGSISPPYILHLNSPLSSTADHGAQTGHFVVVTEYDFDKISVLDPSLARNVNVASSLVYHQWSGYALVPKHTVDAHENATPHSLRRMAIGILLSALVAATMFWTSRCRYARRTLVTVIAASLTVWGCGCDTRNEAAPRSRHTFRTETLSISHRVEDIGFSTRGETRTAVFRIANESTTETVESIVAGTPSCKCTRVWLGSASISPGDSVELHVSVAANDMPGPFSAQVPVESASPRWAEVFSVRGCTKGMRLPSDASVSPISGQRSALLKGTIFSGRSDSIAVRVGVNCESRHANCFTVGRPELRPVREQYAFLETAFEIPVTRKEQVDCCSAVGECELHITVKANISEEIFEQTCILRYDRPSEGIADATIPTER